MKRRFCVVSETIGNVLCSLLARIACMFTRKRVIGKFEIVLPRGHRLDFHQRLFKNYDRKLPLIAEAVESKYGDISIVDIGANVGDTAALLRSKVSAPIICVEGNPLFSQLLEQNVRGLPGVVRVVEKFVGAAAGAESLKLVTDKGTARLEVVGKDQCSIEFITYADIGEVKKDLPQTRLVKIDTDGYDFKIILSSIKCISKDDSVLFFEFDPSFLSDSCQGEPFEALTCLLAEKYVHYLIYDNFGNMMLSFSFDHERIFYDLVRYLRQARENGGGVNYYDVCCFKEIDYDLFRKIITLEEGM